MAAARKRYIDGTHGQVHVRVAEPQFGSKRPLLCLHMFPQSGRSFETFMQVASKERTVVAPDFPGQGESDCPDAPIVAEEYAAAMWQAVDTIAELGSAGPMDVFGIHAGAKLAVEMTRQRPQDIHRLALSSAAVLEAEEIATLRSRLEALPLDEEGSRFQSLWQAVSRNRGPDATLSMCAVSFAELLRHGDRYTWGSQAVFEYNLTFPQVLKSIQKPVLLLNPGDELYKMTPRTVDYLQDVTLIDLPDWTHGYLDVHADAAAEIVLSWLDREL